MAIESKELLEFLVPLYPGLRDRLVASAHACLTKTGEISSCSVFSETSNLVIERISAGDFTYIGELFYGVERCLTEGSTDVSTAAATCFLENLQNRQEIGLLAAHFMGPLAKQHCRAWDKFTGVVTPGL
ncbi:DUF7674 family protein [Xanthomonas melonis]|uniref:DUF7674 family protein n=1 Tax=Xanthomonas melonis TaxID=56456 RepID=UPI003EC0CB62